MTGTDSLDKIVVSLEAQTSQFNSAMMSATNSLNNFKKSTHSLDKSMKNFNEFSDSAIMGMCGFSTKFNNQMSNMGHSFEVPTENLHQFSDAAILGMDQFSQKVQQNIPWVSRFLNKIKNLNKRFKETSMNSKDLTMSLLGVMFFGMMMQRMFMNLLNPALEAFGVFDLFSDMLLILMLPTMEALMPYLLQLFEWVVNLPPETKELIGKITLLGLALGTALMVIGQFGLGLRSIGMLVGSLPSLLNPVTLAIAAIIAVLIAFGIVSFRQLSISASAAANYIKASFEGNFSDMNDYMDITVKGMILAIQKFAYTIVQYYAMAAAALHILWVNFRNWFISKIVGFMIDKIAEFVDKLAVFLSLVGANNLARQITNVSNSIRGLKENVDDSLQSAAAFEAELTKSMASGASGWAADKIKALESETDKLESLQKAVDTGYLTGQTANQSIQVAVSSLDEARRLYDELGILSTTDISTPFKNAQPSIEEATSALLDFNKEKDKLLNFGQGELIDTFGQYNGAANSAAKSMNASGVVNPNINISNTYNISDANSQEVKKLIEDANKELINNILQNISNVSIG